MIPCAATSSQETSTALPPNHRWHTALEALCKPGQPIKTKWKGCWGIDLMNYDEFAFFNQQLAVMLRDGIPLEGALKQLCAGMRAGPLRAELQQLEADLARGIPLKQAVEQRTLPPFYVQMVEIGVRSNDLPGVLTLLAD